MKICRKFICCLLPGFLLILQCCSSFQNRQAEASFYALDDFTLVPKIDAHVHIRTLDTAFISQAGEDQFRLLSIVVDEAPGIDVQQQFAISQNHKFPERVAFATTFSLQNFNSDQWAQQTINSLQQSFYSGAIAVKMYKNIGMELKDQSGNMVMIDDPKFKPVLAFIAQAHIPVVGHFGEPRNCWLPMEQMTMNTDKRYYTRHPEFYMYLHPEYPSYNAQLNARDRMLEQNPNLRFIGAHLGSMEWNTDELAKRLDRFPNMAVDMAARISHLQFQTMKKRKKVHDFFIQYQDRLIYGTDRIADGTKTPEEMKNFVHDAWLNDWKFFCTGDTMRSGSFEGLFKGLQLPKTVADKIYFKNAEAWFPGMKKMKR